MKTNILAALAFAGLYLLAVACQPQTVCPPDSVTYVSDPALLPTLSDQAGQVPAPVIVEIGGREVQVDRVIEGPICNDVWSGTIYVACNIQVVEWLEGEAPLFLKNCDLTIEPDTVVYVAAHNDAAYYKGCSCHVGGEAE